MNTFAVPVPVATLPILLGRVDVTLVQPRGASSNEPWLSHSPLFYRGSPDVHRAVTARWVILTSWLTS